MIDQGIEIRKVQTQEDMEQVWAVRKMVFVEEQGVDGSMEFEFEDESHHFLALLNGRPIGAARWRDSGNGVKLERFAVLKDHRNGGIGGRLVEAVLADLPQGNRVYLHAQLPAVEFYSRYGFEKIGEQFEEAGIQHFVMELKMKN